MVMICADISTGLDNVTLLFVLLLCTITVVYAYSAVRRSV
jgi:hypothetical protein